MRLGPSLDLAQRIVAAAVAQAERLDLAMAVAVCDGGGHLVAFARMDGASLLAGATAPAKARTAVFLRRPTEATVDRARRNPEVYGSFMTATSERLVLSMGGEPLWDGDEVLGAVAAAGGTGREDIVVAKAGLAVWEGAVDGS